MEGGGGGRRKDEEEGRMRGRGEKAGNRIWNQRDMSATNDNVALIRNTLVYTLKTIHDFVFEANKTHFPQRGNYQIPMRSIVNKGKHIHRIHVSQKLQNAIKPSVCGMQTMSHTAPSYC